MAKKKPKPEKPPKDIPWADIDQKVKTCKHKYGKGRLIYCLKCGVMKANPSIRASQRR